MSDLKIQPNEKDAVRVAILNSSAVICKGLEFVVESIPNVILVGTATNTDSGLALCRSTTLDLVITDAKTPLLDGILITQTVKEELPQVKVLILTAISDDQQIFDALLSGADGYCLNDVSSEKVKNAILSGSMAQSGSTRRSRQASKRALPTCERRHFQSTRQFLQRRCPRTRICLG